MSRSFARILVIAIVCMSVALLAGKTLAAARGDSPVWTTSGPGATSPQSGPDAGSPSSTPTNGSMGAPGVNGNGPAGVETPGSEGPEANEQNTNEVEEQEMAGPVASVNTDNSTFTINTATGSVVVAVTSQTEFEDGLTGLSGLHQGMSVRVDSTSRSAGHLVATKVSGPTDNGAPENSNDSSDSNS